MPSKSAWFCARCKVIHAKECPARVVGIVKWKKAETAKKKGGRGGRPWERKRKAVFERDSYLCQECLRNDIYTYVSLHGVDAGICDHIMPIEEGGSDELENLQTLCKPHDNVKTRNESERGRKRSEHNKKILAGDEVEPQLILQGDGGLKISS